MVSLLKLDKSEVFMQKIFIFLPLFLSFSLLNGCISEASKKCQDNQALVNGSCISKEPQIDLPSPTPDPTPVIQPKLSCGNIADGAFEMRTMYQTAAANE